MQALSWVPSEEVFVSSFAPARTYGFLRDLGTMRKNGLALGGSISLAFLVAVFVSNLPEGVAGTMNLEQAGHSRDQIFWMWTTLVLISGACAALGYAMVGWLPGADGRRVQAFAAGAMLTMLADAMMPEGFEHGGKVVGLAHQLQGPGLELTEVEWDNSVIVLRASLEAMKAANAGIPVTVVFVPSPLSTISRRRDCIGKSSGEPVLISQ